MHSTVAIGSRQAKVAECNMKGSLNADLLRMRSYEPPLNTPGRLCLDSSNQEVGLLAWGTCREGECERREGGERKRIEG